MKAVFQGNHLLKAVKTASLPIEKYTSISILRSVLFTHEGGGTVRITGTNLDIEVMAHVDAIDLTDGFCAAIDAKLLMGALKSAGAAPVTIDMVELDTEKVNGEPGERTKETIEPAPHYRITVGDGDAEYIIQKEYDPDDFPRLIGGEATYKAMDFFGNGSFAEFLSLAFTCVSNEETRYYLNGVFWEPGRFTATDGHRLVSKKFSDDKAHGSHIIPRATCSILLKIATGNDVSTFEIEGKYLSFAVGDIRVNSKTIDGTFPDYQRVIPKPETVTAKLKFQPDQLRGAVQKAADFYRGDSRSALAFKNIDGMIWVTSNARERFLGKGSQITAKTHAPWPEGIEPFTFGLNMYYLLDLVPAGMGEITLNLIDAGSPITISAEREEGMTRVIMPMRV